MCLKRKLSEGWNGSCKLLDLLSTKLFLHLREKGQVGRGRKTLEKSEEALQTNCPRANSEEEKSRTGQEICLAC